MPSFSTSRIDTIFSAPALAVGRRLAELHQPRIDAALQQELGVLVDAVVVHAAAGMASGLVAQVQLVMLGHEAQAQHARLQVRVGFHARRWLRLGLKPTTGTRSGTQARQPSQ